MKLLVFIFWCIVFFYVAGLIGRLFIRSYVDRRVREFSSQQGRRGAESASRSRKREGEVKVQRIERIEKQVDSSVGEYVEYEEIDEKGEK